MLSYVSNFFFFFQAEDGIRDRDVTGVQTCALPISSLLCGRAEEERGNDGNRVGGAKLDEPGDDGDADLERDQDGGVDRGDLGRQDELARVPPDLKQTTLHGRAILTSPPSPLTS